MSQPRSGQVFHLLAMGRATISNLLSGMRYALRTSLPCMFSVYASVFNIDLTE